jgi:hypothetical protein
MSVGSNVTPRAVIASSYKELERRMAMISAKRGTYIKFHSIARDPVSKRWVAWFDYENKLTIFKNEE